MRSLNVKSQFKKMAFKPVYVNVILNVGGLFI